MYLKKKIIIPILYMIVLSQTWAGPGSTTDDLMSQFNNSAIEPTIQAQESCAASEMIDTANENGVLGRPWVVFNNPEKLRDAFNFEKTLNQIVSSAPSSPSTTAAELVASLIDSFDATSVKNPESDLITPIDRRNREKDIDPQTAVDEWFPVGVFNRLDTAPLNGDHCGEYRIVYANPENTIQGRFFTIFEAAIPNPQPSKGIQGCQPIAEFWASLADPVLTDDERVIRLEEFFYQGIEVESSGQTISIEPAVSFSHYARELGQVRTNQFIDSLWQLREFKTTQDDDSGNVKFAVETVKNNALTEFYNLESDFPTDDPQNLQLFDTLSGEFQPIFSSTLMDELTSADATAQDANALINGISMVVPNEFNEFQSGAQNFSKDNILLEAGAALRAGINHKLNEINTAGIPTITEGHILARAEAMSCGGCHELATGEEIGTLNDGSSVKWPRTLGFVHINEGGNLSPALQDVFLPARETVLKGFVCLDTPPPHNITLNAQEDANNRADLDGLLAVSKWEHAFFKFDATNIEPDVSKATLRVFYEARRAPITLFVGAVDDDNWTESSGTPPPTFIHDRPELQLANVEGTTTGYVEFDVTDFVANQIRNDGIVSLEVSSNIDNWDILSSKEGEFPPELVIETGAQSNQPPNAAFSATPESGDPLTALLDASESNDPDGEIISFEWDLGDGTTATGVNVSHTYNDTGTFTIKLTVTDDKEGTDVVEKVVTVNDDSNDPTLISGYPFEEGSGQNILDLSGNGNNGTLEGGATRSITGKFGEAIEFNGSSSHIKLSSIDVTSPTLSIALWFKADDFDIHDARLISKSTGTAESDHYWMVSTIRSGGQQKLRFRLKTDNGGTATLIGNASLVAGAWTHVTAVYDGVEMKLFQDGVEVGSLTKSGAISTSSSVETWIGANPGDTRFFDGLIDDVRIYGEVLDHSSIEDIMLGNLPLIP